jgi:hypothetical protein
VKALPPNSGSELAVIGQEVQCIERELTWKEFHNLVRRVARKYGDVHWWCAKHDMTHASGKGSTQLGHTAISSTTRWSAHVGQISVDRENARDCVMMLIANLVAEKHL